MTDDSLGQPKTTSCAVVTQTFTKARLSAPFIIDGAVRQWPARDWTVDKLADALGEKTFRCRLMPLEREVKGVPVWEAEGVYVNCQLRQFNSWCQGEASQDNPLAPFSPLHFSAYIDYKYMTQVFAETPHMLGEVRWKTVGLENLDGQNSTIWIGSTGASTPCHYDTYGFNLVAQIQGRKRWVLVPPGDSACMYPTRIPYEESSVFSQVDVTCPDLRKFPAFKKVQPMVITLEPGQVLYVPRHWWHYVTCTQTAISVNTWVDVPEDNASRLQEAVTRVLASSVIPYLAQTAGPAVEDAWINPTEELEGAAVSVEYLKAALSSWQPAAHGSPWKQAESGEYFKQSQLTQIPLHRASTQGEQQSQLTQMTLHRASTQGEQQSQLTQMTLHRASTQGEQQSQLTQMTPHRASTQGEQQSQLTQIPLHRASTQGEQQEHGDPNNSSSRTERLQEDCGKHLDSNTTPHQADTAEPHPLPEKCSYSGDNSSSQTVTTDTRVTSDQTGSKRLGQLARALQCCPLQCVESPFCLSEHDNSVGHTMSGTTRRSCGSLKQRTHFSADSLSRKRKHSDCNDSVSESKTSTEACLQRRTNFNQLEKSEDAQGTHNNKMLCSYGDSETYTDTPEKLVTDLQSANMSVYVPKPSSLQRYLQMLQHKDSTKDVYSETDVEEGDMFLARETEKETWRGLEKEETMSHAEEREGGATCHDQKEGVAPYSNEKENDSKRDQEGVALYSNENENDSENVQDRSHGEDHGRLEEKLVRSVQDGSHGEDHGRLEEKLLRSVLHPDVVKLIVQKMVDQI